MNRPCTAESQGLISLARAIGLYGSSAEVPAGIGCWSYDQRAASTFSQPEHERVLGMELLLGVELCVLTGFVAYGWGPEGYRTLQRRKRRRRSRVSGVGPQAAYAMAERRDPSRGPRADQREMV